MTRRSFRRKGLDLNKKKVMFLVLCMPVLAVFLFVLYKQITSSLFFLKKDRINVVFYGKDTVFYSLGKYDNVNYYISFYPDVKVKVPGGYGNYRIGGLGKLVFLEKKNDMIQKTFSVTTASTVDRFFYDTTQDIFYGTDEVGEDTLKLPSCTRILFSHSNSTVFDRIFLCSQFFAKRPSQMEKIDYKSSLGIDEEFFQDKDFAKKYQGFLYNRVYRKEQKTVQILYSKSYKTAYFISRVIEGDGIRVSDLSQKTVSSSHCEIVENTSKFSQSAIDISRFFGCRLLTGQTESSDIIMKLGNLEAEWEIL